MTSALLLHSVAFGWIRDGHCPSIKGADPLLKTHQREDGCLASVFTSALLHIPPPPRITIAPWTVGGHLNLTKIFHDLAWNSCETAICCPSSCTSSNRVVGASLALWVSSLFVPNKTLWQYSCERRQSILLRDKVHLALYQPSSLCDFATLSTRCRVYNRPPPSS